MVPDASVLPLSNIMSVDCYESSRGSGEEQSSFPFCLLPMDCQLLILQYLTSDDLNEFAILSSLCCVLRAEPMLPQIRTGAINIGRRITIDNLLLFFANGERLNDVFQSPRTRLKLTNHSDIRTSWVNDIRRYCRSAQLLGVTSLDISFRPKDSERHTATNLLTALSLVLPNLRELDMSYMKGRFISENIAKNCRNLELLKFNGAETGFYFTGKHCLEHFSNLKELHLDGSHLRFMTSESEMPEGLLSHCNSKLERVSLKRATTDNTDSTRHRPRPLNDSELMEFVRATPTLRWLRSDLSSDSVATLHGERPEVHFVA